MINRFRNTRILTVIFILLIVFIIVFSFISLDKMAQNALFDSSRQNLKGSASIIASQIDGDSFALIQSGDESTPAYTSLKSMLDSIRRSDPSIRYIYTMRQNGSAVEFVVDADYGTVLRGAAIGDPYENPSPALRLGFLLPSAETELTADTWGTTLSGFAPIRDSRGNVAGLVGIDMDKQDVVDRMQYASERNVEFLIIILLLFSLGVIVSDVYRNRVEIIIERANTKINVLNNIIRHDIFNTLTALIGYEEMAQGSTTMPEIQEKLTTISVLTQKLERQITITRDYQDLGLSMPQWQNIQEIITRVIAGENKSEILFTMEFGNLEIFADPLLKKVFHHLIKNAVEYGQTITKIHGYYQRSGSDIIVIIEDDGVGVPVTEKEGIFKHQFYKNSGLGLFLAQEILSMTDYSIRETGEPGKGARFEITVPKGNYRFDGNEYPEKTGRST
jgi:signal transduction histidine kinase